MAQGWSSLPADLVNGVADCLLATNDLDCYVDLRAVCHHWRSVTADPRSCSQHDLRFRPSRWVMLDEDKVASSANTDGALLFVNTASGRFLRRSLPLLRDRDRYTFVTSTTDGLLVLAAKVPPHAVSVLNPFTGSVTRFAAPLPLSSYSWSRLTADVVGGSSPTLVMISIARRLVYWAEPQSESFSVEKNYDYCPASRLPLIAAAGKCAAVNRESVPGAENIFDQFWCDADNEDCRCYGVAAAGGDMWAVLKWRRHGVEVFKVDASGNVVDRVKSIGSQALFLGIRCLVVDTHYFPTVEPNCAYFQLIDQYQDQSADIYKFSIGSHEEEPELVSAAMGNMRPWTLTQLLCNYTMDIPVPGHPLTWEERCSNLEDDCEDYIDYVSDEDYGYQQDWGDFDQYVPDDDDYCPWY